MYPTLQKVKSFLNLLGKDLPEYLPWCCSPMQSDFHDFKHSAKLDSHSSSRTSETLVSTLRSSISDSNWRHSWWNKACGSVSEYACSWVTWLKSRDSSEDLGDILGMNCPYKFFSFTLRPSLCHSSKKKKRIRKHGHFNQIMLLQLQCWWTERPSYDFCLWSRSHL